MRGVNDDEVVDFARFGRESGVEVRFIEWMPLDADEGWTNDRVVSQQEIVDAIHDAAGQRLVTTDARGHETWTIYDNLGRATRTFRATATADEILAETDYDRISNRVEARHPRHFAEGIDAVETWTYNGRDLVATHTTAEGSPVFS